LNKEKSNFFPKKWFMPGIILLLFSLIFLSSCNQKLNKYYDCKWTCTDPIIEFTVGSEEETNKDGNLVEGFVINDDLKIDVICLWTHTNALHIFFKDKFSFDDNSINFDEEIAFAANYKKRKGNKVYLEVVIDNIFDNKYKNITLTRHDL
jgi:hypothetical protein